jgi:hypothetical protein
MKVCTFSQTDSSVFTILRPRKSAKRPLVIAPIIAPIVNIDPKIANCGLNVKKNKSELRGNYYSTIVITFQNKDQEGIHRNKIFFMLRITNLRDG